MKFIRFANEYYCECGAEPMISTGNKVKYCPSCGGYKTLHKRRNTNHTYEIYNVENKENKVILKV